MKWTHVVMAGLCACLQACGGGGPAAPVVLPEVDVSRVEPMSTATSLPEGWQDGVYMEIFVRAYQDSDGDGVGDFAGLTQRLDYLQALGVKGLWLMPIQPSQDADHGYAVTDYRAVNPSYGTWADFQNLINEAHRRGIAIVLDYVINHSAAQHPAFVNARQGSSNAFSDWYVWSNAKPTGWRIYGSDPWHAAQGRYYFGGFWDQMPDFNLRNEQVVEWHLDNMRFWLNAGVDGFRFDAVGNLIENGAQAWEHQPQNHILMSRVRQLVNSYDGRFMVCEAPSSPQRYAQADSCGSAFAFGYQTDVTAAVRGDTGALARAQAYWQNAPEGMVGFVSNHDRFAGERLADQFNGNVTDQKLASALYLLQSRRPFIYYGEEIGMRAPPSLSGDPGLRTPMSWTADAGGAGFTTGRPFRTLAANYATMNVQSQQADSQSLLQHYQQVIALRNALPALAKGQYHALAGPAGTLVFERRLGAQRVLVAFNLNSVGTRIALDGLPANAVYRSQWSPAQDGLQTDSNGGVDVTLSARAFGVWVLE